MCGICCLVIFLARRWREPEGRLEASSQKNRRPEIGAGTSQTDAMRLAANCDEMLYGE